MLNWADNLNKTHCFLLKLPLKSVTKSNLRLLLALLT